MKEIIERIGTKTIIIASSIFLGIVVLVIAGALIYNKFFYKRSFKDIETIMTDATINYCEDHKNSLPKSNEETNTIKVNKLVSGEYMKSISDYLKDDSIKETSLKLDEIKSLIWEKKPWEKRNYVLIIDEINRWNISKIFWELITLIEPNKRLWWKEQIKVKLPYSQKEFWVPNNLYILWTMNTADRSIALMDLALRRRFTFKEIEPDSSLLEWINVNWINVRKFFDTVNKRIEFLYDRDHLLGHAYFLPLKEDPSLERLNHIVLDKVIPLLQEYFHDDWEKIQLVLWKWLIHSEDIIASDILWTDTSDYEDQTRYYINFNPTAWDYNI